MRQENHKGRVAILLMLFFAGYAVIVARIFFLQIVQKDFYEDLAKSQYQTSLTVTPPRAEIVDRYGQKVALNQEVASVFLLPHKLKSLKKIKSFLGLHFPKQYKEIVAGTKKKFMWLERKVSQERLAMLRKNLGDDLCVVHEPKRYYPLQAMAHVVGFTDIDNNGLSGIELQFSKQLQGEKKTLVLERDARSRNFYFDKNVEERGVLGKPVSLTLDSSLQVFAYQELKNIVNEFEAKLASVLIINPDTGEILTMANYPPPPPPPHHLIRIKKLRRKTFG